MTRSKKLKSAASLVALLLICAAAPARAHAPPPPPLLPARWSPLTNFPSSRYTATFRLNVPDSFAVAGTGKALAPTPTKGRNSVEGNRLVYTFQCDAPAPHGTFVAGNLQLNPKQAEGVSVAVYAPREASANAQEFANSVARSTIAFSDMFGPLPRPEKAIVERATLLANSC